MKGVFRGPRSRSPRPAAYIHAALGPTNTGKTHYALERMMAHPSGIIGFPLRLLARENYERLAAVKGREAVALLTGEEKIVPPSARWFSCTVEAMPLDRDAAFVAVDEIQLASDPDRGHIFTDRLLHARGLKETLFLGAETIRPVLQRLVPGIAIETRTRLSTLRSTGASALSRLPSRSAIVAFSVNDVYALAEVIRQKRGGCAIIMGRLSPRTRNAQIELYQNRDVDYLVATDAIGMGLNMNVDHVALAALSKFDGAATRALQPQEIAQIAGRAGRGMKDGTFGTLTGGPPMSETLIDTVEQHRFDPIRRLYWRNTALDFASPETLLGSLTLKPPSAGLAAGRIASDVSALETLLAEPDIRRAARNRRATALLWECCQIPDFRKLGDESHARLCGGIFLHLLKDGALPAEWMERHIRVLDRVDGDIETLMHRLTGVRVCSYIAAKPDWTRQAADWQERSRALEDKLSDALHERLTARFVNRRATVLLRRPSLGESPSLLSSVTKEGRVIVEGQDVGHVEGFTFRTDAANGAEQNLLLKAGRRALSQEIPRRVRALCDSPDEAFALTAQGELRWQDAPIARLAQGESALRPAIRLLSGELQDGQQRERIVKRLEGFVEHILRRTLKTLFDAYDSSDSHPSLRGILYRLLEDGGFTPLLPSDGALAPEARAALRRLGVTVGERMIFCPSLFKPRSMALIVLLKTARTGRVLAPPPPGRVCLPAAAAKDLPGWIVTEPVALRIDAAETILHHAARLTRKGDHPAPPWFAPRLGLRKDKLPHVLAGLNIAHRLPAALGPEQPGPPMPLMLLARRRTHSRRRSVRRSVPSRASQSPFSILLDWQNNRL